MPRMGFVLTWLAAVCAGAASVRAAATVDVEIAWVEGKPHGRLTLAGGPAASAAPPVAAWTLVDAKSARLAQGDTKLTPGPEQSWSADVPLDKILDPKQTHRWEVTLRDAALELDYGARLTFAAENAPVPWYGIAHQGIWPRRTIFFLASLPGFKSNPPRDIPVEIVVRDGDDAVVLQRPLRLPPSEIRQSRRIDVTPDTTTSVG
ncbi:MAG TPA: hypothetical protein VG433_00370, partial [Pirellulales bacterium]|nr:hypothetical protein [Pirellulales bacterium]